MFKTNSSHEIMFLCTFFYEAKATQTWMSEYNNLEACIIEMWQ